MTTRVYGDCDCVPGHRCDCTAWGGPAPRIVCICGSTRFAAHMNTEAERLTLDGAIVVRPEVIAYSRERDQQFVEPEVKAALDVLHLRKIDLADEVVVVTVEGYVGESTRREIAYAANHNKPVRYAEYG
jgi:hypothetical protein